MGFCAAGSASLAGMNVEEFKLLATPAAQRLLDSIDYQEKADVVAVVQRQLVH